MIITAIQLAALAALAASADPAVITNTPQTISLEEAINVAVSNNTSMLSLGYSLASRRVELQARKNRFRINVRPELYSEQSGGNRTDAARLTALRDTAIGTTLSASAGTTRTDLEDTNSLYRTSLRFQISQPLLRSVGTLINLEPIRDAQRAVRNARREIFLRQTDLIVEVVQAHETLVTLQRRIEYQTRTIERLEQFVRLTRAREKQGRATRVDTMRAELRLGNAKLRIASIKDTLVSEQASFAELLGRDPSQVFTAATSEALVIDIPSHEEALASAVSNRLDYAQILDDFEDARRGVQLARRNLLPDLRLIARYEMLGEDEAYSESSRLDEDVWFVGFQLASDFPRRDEKSELATAELTAGLSGLQIESVMLAIKKQVRQALSTYRKVLAEQDLADKNYQIARKRVKLARKFFEMGKGDSFSVSEAEDELLDAEEQLLSSQSAASVASYRLMRIIGALIEYPDDLKPGAVR